MTAIVNNPNSTIAEQANIPTKSPLVETKDSLLSYLNGFLSLAWLGGMASKAKTVQSAVTAVKATKAVAQVAHVAQAAKNIKLFKSVFSWVSRGAKALGVIAAPFTGGASLAVTIGAGLALDVVAGELIDAGITYANGGKQLDDNKNDWIKLGDWAGQGLHRVFA